MRRLAARLTASSVALSLLVAACAGPARLPGEPGPGASTTAAASGGDLRIALPADLVSLDPWNAGDASSRLVGRQVYETLVGYDSSGLRLVPGLATRWQSSADGTVWTLTLRQGVSFHDGTALDAAAVALNFQRALDRGHPARGTHGRFAAFAARWSADGETVLAAVAAPDPVTVVFTLRSGFGPFLADLADPSFAIVSPRSMQADPDGWMLPGSGRPAGTGPFQLLPGGWQPGRSLVLERHPGYWRSDEGGLRLPYLDRLTFRVVPDGAARIAELRAGTLDVVHDLSSRDVATVRGSPNLRLLRPPPQDVVYLGLTHTRPPFGQLAVRQAVATAIDRQAIAQAVFPGQGRAAAQLIPPGMLGHDDSVVDLARRNEGAAKDLLAAAGLARGFETELWYGPSARTAEADVRKVAEIIAADLGRIGIRVRVRRSVPALSGREPIEHPLYLAEAAVPSADPDGLIPAWWDPQARSLLWQARRATAESRRAELYKQVSKMAQQQVPWIPLLHPPRPVATTRKVHGLVPQATGAGAFTRVGLGR